jgi:hypothetical protein
MNAEAPIEPTMGKHRRRDEEAALAVMRYEELLRVLYQHKPAQRSGLCLVCGIGWPCVEVWVVLGVRPTMKHEPR